MKHKTHPGQREPRSRQKQVGDARRRRWARRADELCTRRRWRRRCNGIIMMSGQLIPNAWALREMNGCQGLKKAKCNGMNHRNPEDAG